MQRNELKNKTQSVHLPRIHGAAFPRGQAVGLGNMVQNKTGTLRCTPQVQANSEPIKSLFCCCKMLRLQIRILPIAAL